MKYLSLNLSKLFPLLATISLLFTACDKVKTTEPLNEVGQTIVKLIGGGSPALIKEAIDFVPKPATLSKGVIDIRRDVPNATELNRTMTVVLKDDTAAVRAANPNYTILPAAWYTLSTSDNVSKVGGSGGTWTFTFKPGELAKQIYITIPDATKLNPSTIYALGFTIISADADGKISSSKTVVVEIGAKNKYDGIYAVTGPMIDVVVTTLSQYNFPTAPGFPAAHGGAWELHLITTGANSVVMYDNTAGDYYHSINSDGVHNVYGLFALIINFDPVTDKIVSVTNYYGQPSGNTRSAVLDPSGVNAVQGNRDILIKYWMIQTNQPTGTNPRVFFDEKWEYIGPR